MPSSPPCVVLDTNVVLDWLVFGNVHSQALAARIVSGEWHWIATPAMSDELEAVLQYPLVQRWSPDVAKIRKQWSDWARPAPEAPRGPLACQDGDDQKFIDLALAHPAQWLFTRDRALLKLASRARAWQLSILTPERFQVGSEPMGNLAASTAATSLR